MMAQIYLTLKEQMNAEPEAIRIQRVREYFLQSKCPSLARRYSDMELLSIADRLENPGFWRTKKQLHWLANPFGPLQDRRNLRIA